jgi:hypothetical protein
MINIDLTKKDGVNIDFTANVVYGEGEGKPIDIAQTVGGSKNAVMSQFAVTQELSKKTDDDTVAVVAKTGNYSDLKNRPDVYTRTEVDNKIKDTKNYLDSEISKIDVPDVSKLATKAEMSMKADRGEIPTMTSQLMNNSGFITKNDIPTIPTALSQLEDDSNHRLVTDEEKQNWDNKSDFSGDYNDLKNQPTIPDVSGFVTEDTLGELVNTIAEYVETKANKTSVITSEDINNITLDWDKEYRFTMTKDTSVVIYDKPNDDYAHSIEIEMTTDEEIYSFSTNLEIQWVKDLEIEPNKRYMIIIDDSMTAMWIAVERSEQ